jgi:lysophospholipase L1-like esterase
VIVTNNPVGDAANLELRPWHMVRKVALVLGVVLIAVSLGFDYTIGGARGFGTAQKLLLFLGVTGVIAAFTGRRIVGHYKTTVIVIANTIILLLVLDLGAVLAGSLTRSGKKRSANPRAEGYALARPSAYHKSVPWGATYRRERDLLRSAYAPYVVWRRQAFSGETINLDASGVRRTPGAQCTPRSYKVFAFGGSTMWGMGVPDWGTIPAYLQAELSARIGRAVCVVNHADPGYVSTQSVIALVSVLQAGHVPDLVIFYDGVNDPAAAAGSGKAGAHYNLSAIKKLFSEREHPLETWLHSWHIVTAVEGVARKRAGARPEVLRNADSLAHAVAQAYFTNYETVAGLADRLGFQFAFFWQPSIATTKKPLTEEEQEIKGLLDESAQDLLMRTYPIVEAGARKRDRLFSITDAHDHDTAQVWIDWFHVTAEANQLIAKRMLDVLAPRPATQ